MRAFLTVCLLVLVCGAAPGAAEVEGQDDPRFYAALEMWLADDDATSLPEFAALAAGGNRAAQILLALIDTSPTLQGPWLVALPRADRIALMRQPGGLSGRSWMAAAAEESPLAAAWLALWSAGDRDEFELARAFAALGEDRAVRMTLLAVSLRQGRGFAELAEDPIYPPSLRFLIWQEWADDPAFAPRIAAEIAALPPGDPQIATVTGRRPAPADRAAWLATAAPASPLRAYCAAVCPETASACLDAAFAFHDGPELADFGSPVESLVPTAAWETSPRGLARVLRRRLDPLIRANRLAELAARDACFATALEAEAARLVK